MVTYIAIIHKRNDTYLFVEIGNPGRNPRNNHLAQ